MQNPESEATKAVKQLILASIPERAKELDKLWKEYSPVFSQIEDKPGFNLEGGPFGLVLFTLRTMQEMWILGFAAQTAFYGYSGIVLLSVWSGVFNPELLSLVKVEGYNGLMLSLRMLQTTESPEDFPWPQRVPHPEAGKPTDASGAMVFDLLCMAGVYAFLHEVQHVKFKSDPAAQFSPTDEEFECDKFGRVMLFDNIEAYSKASGYSAGILKTKRAMAVGLASFFILALTPQSAWGGSRSHPSVRNRIAALTDSLSLPPNDHFWIYLTSLVTAHLRFSKIKLSRIAARSTKALCLELLGLLPSS